MSLASAIPVPLPWAVSEPIPCCPPGGREGRPVLTLPTPEVDGSYCFPCPAPPVWVVEAPPVGLPNPCCVLGFGTLVPLLRFFFGLPVTGSMFSLMPTQLVSGL